MKIIALIALIISGGYYWHTKNVRIHTLQKKRIKKTKPNAKKTNVAGSTAPKKSDFRCVTIKMDRNPCSTVRTFENKPILMHEAGSLPLKGCYKEICDCRFSRHEDRRMTERRTNNTIAQQFTIGQQHRRESVDRRVSAR